MPSSALLRKAAAVLCPSTSSAMGGWLDEDVAAEVQHARLSAPMRLWLDKRRTAPSATATDQLTPSRPSTAGSTVPVLHPPTLSTAASSPSTAVVVSMSECRGASRPLLSELAVKCGWRGAKRDEAAELFFTDIKRAGKRRCFQLVEEGRQRRLRAMRALASSLDSLHCPLPSRVNCYPGMSECVSKCALSRSLSFHQRLFPSEWDFYPVTYDLSAADGLTAACVYLTSHTGSALIVKPSRGSQGKGISLVQSALQLRAVLYSNGGKCFIAQQYIDDPCLLNGHKVDMRVYVLVSSLRPLTLHIFHDGLARVCTEPYRRPSAVNLSHTLSHLSNYSLNKHSLAFKPPTEDRKHAHPVPAVHLPSSTDASDVTPTLRSAAAPFSPPASIDLNDDSNKRSIRAALSQLAHQGHAVDVRRFWADVTEIAEKTVIALTPALWSAYSATFASAAESDTLGSACFHLLGFDCILDQAQKVWLLEVNSAPSMATDSALDWRVKMSVWQSSMHILGMDGYSAAAATMRAGDDEPHSHRSVSSVSSNVSAASSCASILSLSSSKSTSRRSTLARPTSRLHSASRPHAATNSARVLRSNTPRHFSHSKSSCTHTLSADSQQPPLSFDIPAFDWREVRHTTATATMSTCPYLHRALCHPLLLSLYHHFAHETGGLTAATFRRLLSLFASSASWCSPLAAGDAHLLFLQQTKPRGQSVVSFDGLCACLAIIRRRYVSGGVRSDRQEAAVWEQWATAAAGRVFGNGNSR